MPSSWALTRRPSASIAAPPCCSRSPRRFRAGGAPGTTKWSGARHRTASLRLCSSRSGRSWSSCCPSRHGAAPRVHGNRPRADGAASHFFASALNSSTVMPVRAAARITSTSFTEISAVASRLPDSTAPHSHSGGAPALEITIGVALLLAGAPPRRGEATARGGGDAGQGGPARPWRPRPGPHDRLGHVRLIPSRSTRSGSTFRPAAL
jgi:hypothetical protein